MTADAYYKKIRNMLDEGQFGQALFGTDEMAYIANHYIYVDHDQTVTLSGGAHYHFGDSQISADLLYGSGLRLTRTAAHRIRGRCRIT